MTQMKNNTQSQVIDFLRFPLIVGVIVIHSQFEEYRSNFPVYGIFSNLFSHIFGDIAVPAFFLISGFLFFLNIDNFNKQSYFSKLKSRFKTLGIPYLFWNIFTALVFVSLLPLTKNWVTSDLRLLWHTFITEGINHLCFHFWFIRDLIIILILSPIVYFLVRKLKFIGVILLLILFLSGLETPFLSIKTITFFTIGAAFAINKKAIIETTLKLKNISFIVYPIIIVIDLFTSNFVFNEQIHRFGILIGIMVVFNIVVLLLQAKKVKVNRFLASSSFFIFAVHVPWLVPQIKKIIISVFNPNSNISLIFFYFLTIIVTILFALGIYYILRRFLPKFTTIITGGR